MAITLILSTTDGAVRRAVEPGAELAVDPATTVQVEVDGVVVEPAALKRVVEGTDLVLLSDRLQVTLMGFVAPRTAEETGGLADPTGAIVFAATLEALLTPMAGPEVPEASPSNLSTFNAASIGEFQTFGEGGDGSGPEMPTGTGELPEEESDDFLEVLLADSDITPPPSFAPESVAPLLPGTTPTVTITPPAPTLPIAPVLGGAPSPAPVEEPLFGGIGDDTLSGGAGDDGLYGGDGGDLLYGGAGNDLLLGGGGADVLDGETGDDQIYGGAGEDLLSGGVGSYDEIYGGPDNDVLFGDGKLGGAVAGDHDFLFGDGGDDTLYGESQQDGKVGGFVGGNDVLDGGSWLQSGDDVLYGDVGKVGGFGFLGGDDELTGAAGNDVLYGDAGIDLVADAEGGHDAFFGNEGEDQLYGDAGSELTENAIGGNDYMIGGTDSDVLYGDAGWQLSRNATGGDDVLFGGIANFGPNADTLYGDAGSDIRDNAAGGDDQIQGGRGGDVLYGDAGGSIVDTATGGDDTLYGDQGNDVVYGDAGEDLLGLAATGGDDSLYGGDGDDLLFGDAGGSDNGRGGRDTLFGGEGNDTLAGGSGADSLAGDGGADVFIVDEADSDGTRVAGLDGSGQVTNSAEVFGGADRITDFELGLDQLIVRGSAATVGQFVRGTRDATDPASTELVVFQDNGADGFGAGDEILAIITNLDAGQGETLTVGSDLQVLISTLFTENDDLVDLSFASIGDISGIANTTVARGGNDRVILADAGDPNQLAGTFFGGAGDDTLIGGSADDNLAGGTGADYLSGNGGADRFFVDERDTDAITVAGVDRSGLVTNSDAVFGAADRITDFAPLHDTLVVSGSPATIGQFARGLRDATAPESGEVVIYQDNDSNGFDPGDEILAIIENLDGNLFQFLRPGFDLLVQPTTLFTGGGDLVDLAFESVGDLSALLSPNHAGAGDDRVTLADLGDRNWLGADTFFGDQGDDTLIGRGADDHLAGGPGTDRLTGNDGADDFIFDERDGMVITATPVTLAQLDAADVVTDFVIGTDQIVITGVQPHEIIQTFVGTINETGVGTALVIGLNNFGPGGLGRDAFQAGDEILAIVPSVDLAVDAYLDVGTDILTIPAGAQSTGTAQATGTAPASTETALTMADLLDDGSGAAGAIPDIDPALGDLLVSGGAPQEDDPGLLITA